MIEHLHSELASQTAAFDAAERRLEMHTAAGIDRQISGLHGARDAKCAADVASPDRAGQSVLTVVRNAHRIVFAVEGHHGDDRAKNFFTNNCHLRFRIEKNRRLQKRSLA